VDNFVQQNLVKKFRKNEKREENLQVSYNFYLEDLSLFSQFISAVRKGDHECAIMKRRIPK